VPRGSLAFANPWPSHYTSGKGLALRRTAQAALP
jgi:hypothetical protein